MNTVECNKFSSQLVLKLDSQILKLDLYSSVRSLVRSSIHSLIQFYCANSQIRYKPRPALLPHFGETRRTTRCDILLYNTQEVAVDEKVAFTFTRAIAAIRRLEFFPIKIDQGWVTIGDWQVDHIYINGKVWMSTCICKISNTCFDSDRNHPSFQHQTIGI